MLLRRSFWVLILALLSCSMLTLPVQAQSLPDEQHQMTDDFAAVLHKLPKAKFSEKSSLIEQIADQKHAKSEAVLEAMLEARLFYRKSDKIIVFADKVDAGYHIVDVLSDEDYGEIGKRKVKKVSVNNSLRRELKSLIARFQLESEDIEKRTQAIQNIIKSPDPVFAASVARAIDVEQDSAVRQQLLTAQAAVRLVSDDTDKESKIAAIVLLGEVTDKNAIALLAPLVEQKEDGTYVETDEDIRVAAQVSLKKLHEREGMYSIVENLFFGVSLGSVLLLAAVGLAITFGVMGVINMAHGEMIMLGAYTTYVVQLVMPNHIGASLIVAIPAAFLVSGTMGVIIERTVIRHLYGRPLETLLATFGLSLVLQQLVRTIFSPLNRSVITPEWMSGSWHVNGMLSLTYNRLYIIIFSLLVLGGLVLLMRRTFFGLQMRAVTQNRPMASSMGIRTGWVDALTFGLGSGIAGIAGVALSQLTNVGPNLGQAYIIDSFLVVVFGGVGNLFGTFFAAMSLGIANKFFEPLVGAVLAKILILVFIILFIQRRPRGLFAIKGRFVED